MDARFSELEELAAKRHQHLVEFKQFLQFERECDEVEQWVMEKLAIANNEELGKDLEHVEVCTPLHYRHCMGGWFTVVYCGLLVYYVSIGSSQTVH